MLPNIWQSWGGPFVILNETLFVILSEAKDPRPRMPLV